MRYPNLRHLELFQTLLRTRSVTETARLHHISQPAVSKAMSQLQAAVGIEMFKRVQGRLQASEDALRLLAEIERLLNQVGLFGEEVQALHEARHGRLSVAAVPSLAIGAVAPSVARFMEGHPKVLVNFAVEMSSRIVEEVAQHRLDIAFIHGNPQNLNIRAIPIAQSEMVCQLRADHRLAARELIEARDLEGEPLIFLNPGSPPNHLIRESFAKAGVHPNVVAEVNASYLSNYMLDRSVAFVDPMSFISQDEHPTVIRRFEPRVPLQIYSITSAVRPPSRVSVEFQRIAEEIIVATTARLSRTY